MINRTFTLFFFFLILFSCAKQEVCVTCSALCAKTGFSQKGYTGCAETKEEADKIATELIKADTNYVGCNYSCEEIKY